MVENRERFKYGEGIMAILAFLNMVFLKLAGFLLSAILMWTVQAPANVAIEPEDPQNLQLQVSVLSDVHMQSFEYSGFQELAKTLRDIEGSKVKQDALVFVGDNTMNGQIFEYLMFYGLLSRYSPVKSANTLVAMGNHDFFTAPTPQAAIDRHNFFLRSYTGASAGKAYYSQVINGCTFVLLGEEEDDEISEAQVAWLAGTLAAAEPGKPIFVFFHYNLYGPALDILEQYQNVFLFNGHWHTPLDVWDGNGVTHVNLPGLHSHIGDEYAGEGLQIEIYADKVLLRGRNYMTGEWGEDYEIELT